MKFVALYKDPKKRWLQRIEIAFLLLVFPLALVWGGRTAQLWMKFRQAESLYNQAELLLHQDKAAQAIPLLEKALASYSDFLPAWHALGLSYHMAGEHKKELEAYQRAVASFTSDHVLHRDLATAFHENEDHKSELEHLEIASKLPMTDEIFLANLLRRARAEAAGTYPKAVKAVKEEKG